MDIGNIMDLASLLLLYVTFHLLYYVYRICELKIVSFVLELLYEYMLRTSKKQCKWWQECRYEDVDSC